MEEFLQQTLEWMQSGIDWFNAELPIYVEQLIKWKLASNWVGVGIGIILIVLGFVSLKIMYKKHNENKEFGYSDEWMWLWVLVSILWLSGTIILISCTMNVLQLMIAPRVYLIEYIGRML